MKKFSLIYFLIFPLFLCFSSQTEILDELFQQQPQFRNDVIKEAGAIFNVGGALISKSQFLLGENKEYFYYKPKEKYPWGFCPKNHWKSENELRLWGNIVIKEGLFLKTSIRCQLLFAYDFILPTFNIDELYLSWSHSVFKWIIGRTVYSTASPLSFEGTLDGSSIEITLPYLTFHGIAGFTGFTGLFHPAYNDFNITKWDKSYEERSNLIYFALENNIAEYLIARPFNQNQSRRFFIVTEFDFHYNFFHIAPYFIGQLDFSKLVAGKAGQNQLWNSNNDLLLNTFTAGIDGKFKIQKSLYFLYNFSGVFGYLHDVREIYSLQNFSEDLFNPNSANKTPIVGLGLQTELRYNIKFIHDFIASVGYALGTGTQTDGALKDFFDFRTEKKISNQFFYYGDFNGGFVLDPVLSNIHSISVKFQAKFFDFLHAYLYAFQTLKLFKDAPISDEKAVKEEYLVGTEIDAGVLFQIMDNINIAFDSGIYIPESAYNDRTIQLKIGASFIITF